TLRRDRRERDRRRTRARRSVRAAEGLFDEAPHRRLAGAVGRGEAPGTPVDDAETDAAIGRARDRLDLAIAHRYGLVLALDRSRVRVRGAASRGELDEFGKGVGHRDGQE